MSARYRATASSTSPTRCSTAAAYAAISVSSRALRVAIRVSVSWRIRAISAFDQSLMPARSSSARRRRASVPSVDAARMAPVTSVASTSTAARAWSRAASVVARIAVARSTVSLDGFFGAAGAGVPAGPLVAGSPGSGMPVLQTGSSGSDATCGSPSWVAASGSAWEVVPGSTTPASASGAATAEPNRSASSWGRSELHGSRKGERLSEVAIDGYFLYGMGWPGACVHHMRWGGLWCSR